MVTEHAREDCPLNGLGKCTRTNCGWWNSIDEECSVATLGTLATIDIGGRERLRPRFARCPTCKGIMEKRNFKDGVDDDGSNADINPDWWCPACRLRWMDVYAEPEDPEDG